MMPPRLVLLAGSILLTLAAGHLASAQGPPRSGRRERIAAGSVDPVSVRAEYASTLLQARRYREAAAEYRRLLQQQPTNFEWRLNYARALTWGGSHREAEIELRSLSARAPRNATVEALLRSARANIQPSSREARAWLAEQPSYIPYRLALARAYVRERRPRSAFAHFDAVVARQPSAALLSEAGDARAAGGDRRGAADLYRRAVERAPSNTTLRRSYAAALAANRQYAAAIEQYTLLLEERPNPRLLMERADVRRRSGDEEGAERDLDESIALQPTSQAYVALGDMYRWRGQYKRARAAYERGAAIESNDARATTRLALLTREERPGFGYASVIHEEPGMTFSARGTGDNTGFAYVAGGGRYGLQYGAGTVVGIGAEPRVIYDRSPPTGIGGEVAPEAERIVGAAVTAGLAHTYHGEELDARVAGRVGVAGHSTGEPMSLLAGSAVITYQGAWSLSLEGTEGPAYENLMALTLSDDATVFPANGSTNALLRNRTFAVGATAPFGVADVGVEFESMWLSDGNTRSAFQASVRVPVVRGVSLLYAGGAIDFAERSTLYWDPQQYVSHAMGIELGVRTDAGLALTARVLPGIARSVEGFTSGDPGVGEPEPGSARFVGQLAAGADLSVRRRRWETAMGAAFGSGRSGGYRRLDGHLRVRFIP